ncbi:MAG: acyltransferase [Actinomycetota bacterium]|nr:acyltransferase [Actinomycetota bacterium]
MRSEVATVPASATEGPARPQFHLGNRPPLTGIRAPLLFAVLAYHSNFRSFPGAWSALGVFFVLSGFLITAMLSGEGQRTGKVSLRHFYARRALRLLPPLFLTSAGIAIYAAFVPVADAAQRVWGDILAALFYYADYRQALGHAPFFGFLAQTWSLSVEEQFYVIWSVLMVAAVAVGRRRAAYGVGVLGVVASVADRVYLTLAPAHFTHLAFGRVYYAFDTRADALFLGCLLGLAAADGHLSGWGRSAKRVLGVAALASGALLVWTSLFVPLWTRSLLLFWMPASEVASAVLIVFFVVVPKGIGSRVVGNLLFVYIGNLSYTVYLVHFPVYLAISPGTMHWTYWPTQCLRVAVILAIAVPSWHFIERPLTRWRRRALVV